MSGRQRGRAGPVPTRRQKSPTLRPRTLITLGFLSEKSTRCTRAHDDNYLNLKENTGHGVQRARGGRPRKAALARRGLGQRSELVRSDSPILHRPNIAGGDPFEGPKAGLVPIGRIAQFLSSRPHNGTPSRNPRRRISAFGHYVVESISPEERIFFSGLVNRRSALATAQQNQAFLAPVRLSLSRRCCRSALNRSSIRSPSSRCPGPPVAH
jgi:hypothetical protein